MTTPEEQEATDLEFEERITQQHVLSVFRHPRVTTGWLAQLCRGLRTLKYPSPVRDWEGYLQTVLDHVMNSKLEETAERGTGLPPLIATSTTYTVIDHPVVLELHHITEVGLSAFVLNRVRQERDQAYHCALLSLVDSGRDPTPSRLEAIEANLPGYPRKCLKLYLSDGWTTLEALELERLPGFDLGKTRMGVKVCLRNVPIIAGVAYLRQENIHILAGDIRSMHDAHLQRLYLELRVRMCQEASQAREHQLRTPQELFSLSESLSDVD